MTFNIIKNRGRAMQFTADDGTVVKRVKEIWVDQEDWNCFVPCSDDDDHFIYEGLDRSQGSPSFLCTCGAQAIVLHPFTPGKRQFVCQNFVNFGFHATSQVNKKDFEKGNPIVRKGKKWS